MPSPVAWSIAASRSPAPMPRWCSSAGPSSAWRSWAWLIQPSTFAPEPPASAARPAYEPDPKIPCEPTDGDLKMEVILLERVAKLGQMGDVVRVKDGFARNFLLPKGKALRATKDNRAKLETIKVHLEARNVEQQGEARAIADKLNGKSFVVLRQASDTGQLYGSV